MRNTQIKCLSNKMNFLLFFCDYFFQNSEESFLKSTPPFKSSPLPPQSSPYTASHFPDTVQSQFQTPWSSKTSSPACPFLLLTPSSTCPPPCRSQSLFALWASGMFTSTSGKNTLFTCGCASFTSGSTAFGFITNALNKAQFHCPVPHGLALQTLPRYSQSSTASRLRLRTHLRRLTYSHCLLLSFIHLFHRSHRPICMVGCPNHQGQSLRLPQV